MKILGFFLDIIKDIITKVITFLIVGVILLLIINYFLGVNLIKLLF